jgi:HEAT repeat protein
MSIAHQLSRLANIRPGESKVVALVLLYAIVASATDLLGYPKRVQQALRQRIIQGNLAFQPDRASLELLQQSLTSPHPGVVIYALNMLEEFHPEALAHFLPRLLTHTSPTVRLDALERLERRGEITALPAIEHCFRTEPDSQVRSVALRTLDALGDLDQFEEVYNYLDAADSQLRQNVMIGLLRGGELEGILAVSEH